MKSTGRKTATAAIIVLAVVQIPLSIGALSLLAGLARDGAEHFLLLYEMFSGREGPGARSARNGPIVDLSAIRKKLDDAAQSLSQVETVSRAPGAGAADGPTVRATKIDPAITEAPEPLIPEMAELSPRPEPTDLPQRQIANLPVYQPSSDLARLVSAIPELAVDYVSVQLRPISVVNESPVAIRLRPSAEARLIVLAGGAHVSWRILDASPETLAGILVYAPGATTDKVVIGVPDAVPVERIDHKRVRLPSVAEAVPRCTLDSKTNLISTCSDVVHMANGGLMTTFQAAEAELQELLGLRIATLSSAQGDGDRVIVLPEEIVDDLTRQRAASQIEQYRAALSEVQRRRDVYLSYVRRWRDDRWRAVIDEIARHPAPVPTEINARRPRVVIVSTRTGASDLPPDWSKRERIGSYDDYQWNMRSTVGRVDVEVTTRDPTVIFATAEASVDWRFEVAADANVLAVHIEGAATSAPSVVGIPEDIPLTVRSGVFGDRDAIGHVKTLELSGTDAPIAGQLRSWLARITAMYPEAELVLYEHETMRAVSLSDSMPGQVDGN